MAGEASRLMKSAIEGALQGVQRVAVAGAVGAVSGAVKNAATHVAKSLAAAEGFDWRKLSAKDRELWLKRGTVAFLATADYARQVAKGE